MGNSVAPALEALLVGEFAPSPTVRDALDDAARTHSDVVYTAVLAVLAAFARFFIHLQHIAWLRVGTNTQGE